MKIFHCADLHLDTPFSALSPQTALKKKRELCSVLADMVEFAKKESVELFLVAGDLFDTFRISEETKTCVKEAFSSLSCPVVISPGNHDKYIKGGFYSELSELENVSVFKSCEMGRFDFDELGVSVFGYAFTDGIYENDPLSDCPPLHESNINILCAHGDALTPVGSQMAPLYVNEIAERGFAYAALGHWHKPPEPKTVGACTVAYSGFAQGRDFGECGYGGGNLVTVDRNTKKVTVEKRIFSKTRYELEKLDISGAETEAQITEKIKNLVLSRGYGKEVSLRVLLSGTVSKDLVISKKRIEQNEAFSSLGLFEIKDISTPVLGYENLEKDMTLAGEFYRQLLPRLSSGDENERAEAVLALKIGLAALMSQEIGLVEHMEDEE